MFDMNKFEEYQKISIFDFDNSYEEIEYEDSSSDEENRADTPFIVVDNSNEDTKSDSSSESYGSNSDEDEVDDIFIKND